MEREQGMIKGANEVCILFFFCFFMFPWIFETVNLFESPFVSSSNKCHPVQCLGVFHFDTNPFLSFFWVQPQKHCKWLANHTSSNRCSPPVLSPRSRPNPLCKLIPLRKTKRSTTNPATRTSTVKADSLKPGASTLGKPVRSRDHKLWPDPENTGLTAFGCSDLSYLLFDSFISHPSYFFDTLAPAAYACMYLYNPNHLFMFLYTLFSSLLFMCMSVSVMKKDGFDRLCFVFFCRAIFGSQSIPNYIRIPLGTSSTASFEIYKCKDHKMQTLIANWVVYFSEALSKD